MQARCARFHGRLIRVARLYYVAYALFHEFKADTRKRRRFQTPLSEILRPPRVF